jgi:ankyrin repeat protein
MTSINIPTTLIADLHLPIDTIPNITLCEFMLLLRLFNHQWLASMLSYYPTWRNPASIPSLTLQQFLCQLVDDDQDEYFNEACFMMILQHQPTWATAVISGNTTSTMFMELCDVKTQTEAMPLVETLIEQHRVDINQSRTLDGSSVLSLICYKDSNLDMMKLLVRYGANVRQKDDYGYTLLMNAILTKNENDEII